MVGSELPETLSADVAAVGRIKAMETILEVVCRTTGMGFAAVARVTEDRWIACAVRDEIAFGLKPGSELKVETTICDEIRDSGQAVIIDHVSLDRKFSSHPTPAMYGFQSYISMPIVRADGSFFGTLCAIDPHPARLNRPEITGMFKLFAELIAFYLDAEDDMAKSQAALLDARQTAELREQFIAVLGHDLRNPLAAIQGGARLLRKEPLSGKQLDIVASVETSMRRMAGLIDNVLDLTRGRLGGGLRINRKSAVSIEPVLMHIVEEFRSASPQHRIETEFDLAQPVAFDDGRIGQLLSNLLGNALTHGSADALVRVRAVVQDGLFELSVSNGGAPISPEVRAQIFKPFFRAGGSSNAGLGLGLYIASEIACAHGGTLDVNSTLEETLFTARIPLSHGELVAR
jgi:signal transduction histidine kinase